MRDISRNPADHGQTTRVHADESVPDPEKTPELVVVAAAVLAFVVCLANFALGEVGVGLAAAILGLLAFGAGLAWLAMERRRYAKPSEIGLSTIPRANWFPRWCRG
jgi:hypothetical protein